MIEPVPLAQWPEWFAAKTAPAQQRTRVQAGLHPMGLRLAPERGTCGGCAHATQQGRGRYYWKCSISRVTRGPGTDIRLLWPACERFEAKPTT